MYKVIRDFADLTDGGYVYKAGDEYPHLGATPSEDRIRELSGSANKQGVALIEKVKSTGRKTRRR